jgi:hypothetical protein
MVTFQPYKFYLLAGRDKYSTVDCCTKLRFDVNKYDGSMPDATVRRILTGDVPLPSGPPTRVLFAVPNEEYVLAMEKIAAANKG